MDRTDLTIQILKDIREAARQTNDRIEKTNDKLDALWTRQTETEVRLATEIVTLVGAVREVRDLLRDDFALRDRVDDHERRLSAVERRVP
ncbi:MAG TPA: hypothetical protein VGL81_26185 [Polyangiaceae bacterium]|jgi:hypothetical protein